ncbi:MAG: nitrate reductase associated protein [Cyanobacteria bacterium]|nr:nitrate reductase associated protein [Cyanobacteriota bacterium]MDW8201147.1 nitrate reductase associated protein [Cyanobacteriota bacterium SKYGB_h_bin112]
MTCFQFEQDFVNSLRCIPMRVRYNLDACSVKLSLQQWQQLTLQQRQGLLELPCETAIEQANYRQQLQQWLLARTGAEAPTLAADKRTAWAIAAVPDTIPESVQTQIMAAGATLSLTQWQNLTALQRFVLIKLSQPGHEHRNFLPALQEFGLVENSYTSET